MACHRLPSETHQRHDFIVLAQESVVASKTAARRVQNTFSIHGWKRSHRIPRLLYKDVSAMCQRYPRCCPVVFIRRVCRSCLCERLAKEVKYVTLWEVGERVSTIFLYVLKNGEKIRGFPTTVYNLVVITKNTMMVLRLFNAIENAYEKALGELGHF